MYFFKKNGNQCLDLAGNLIITHNKTLVSALVKSAGPKNVYNPKYIITGELTFKQKIKASFHAVKFIWGRGI